MGCKRVNFVNILTNTSSCDANSIKRVFSLLGNLFNIVKIIIPIILIVMGTIDFVKAMITNNPDETKKSQALFIKRLIVAVCVFFVFPIVSFLMSLVGESMDNTCMICFSNPNDKTKCYFTVNNNNDSNSTVKDFDVNAPHEKVSNSGNR